MTDEFCGKQIGRHVVTREMRYCGLPKDHREEWCVTAEAIEYAKRRKSTLTNEKAAYVVLRRTDFEALDEEHSISEDPFFRPVPYEHRHVLDLDEDGWALEHPIDCRLEGRSLHDCLTHFAVLAQMQDGPPDQFGRFAVTLQMDEDGEPMAVIGVAIAKAD